MTSPSTESATQSPLTPTGAGARGRFLWYDLMVPDVDAAVAFYGAVTGWTINQFQTGPDSPSYSMWVDAAGTPIGGVMPPQQEGAPTLWLPYIGTPTIDATHAEALALGAREFVAPGDIPTVGRFSILADPQGTPFALVQPNSPTDPRGDVGPGIGDVSWHELRTTDGDAAFAFYARIAGWEKTEALDMGPQGIYQMYGQGGRTYGGIYGQPGMQPHWLLYVRVPDIHAAVAAVKAHGGTVNREPMEVPGGNIVVDCRDPWGAAFGLDMVPA